MKYNPKVNTALICIGEGAEASWCVFFFFPIRDFLCLSLPDHSFVLRVTKSLPGRVFRVVNTGDIPNVLRSILSTMVDR